MFFYGGKKLKTKKIIFVLGGIFLILGLLLLYSGATASFMGDPSIRAMQRAPYEKWGTIFSVAGGIILFIGIIYKENDSSTNLDKKNTEKDDFSNQLEELKKLLEKEIITQEEYETKKKEILSKL